MTTIEASTDVWYTVCPVPAASSVAFARGDIQAEFSGPDVELRSIRLHPDRAVREAHYNQSQPNAFREGGNIPPLWARSAGRDLRVIGLSWIEHHSAVVARPGSGIDNVDDLKGRRLGLVKRPNDPVDYPRATQLRGYLSALAQAGLSADDVTFVDIVLDEPLVARPPDPEALSQSQFSARSVRRREGIELAALIRGDVDAIHTSARGIELADLAGGHIVSDVGALPDDRDRINNATPTVFTVRGELLDERPDIVARYLAGAIRSARWAKAHPDEARRLVARDTALPEELVDLAYSPAMPGSLEPTVDPELVEHLLDQKEFLLKWGFLEADFDASNLVATEPLERALELVETADA